MSAEDWFVTAFGPDYQSVYAHRDDQSASAEIAGIQQRLGNAPGPVLDLGCGNGRHLAAMRRAGIPAFGCDLSANLLADAASRSEANQRIARADMRALPVRPRSLGAITLLFTAFGYFDDATNLATLQGCGTTLCQDGWLLLDLPDLDQVVNQLVPESRRTLADGRDLHEVRTWDGERVRKTVTIRANGAIERQYTEDVRLYRSDDMAELLVQAGLHLHDIWPSLEGPHHHNGRMVVWSRPQ